MARTYNPPEYHLVLTDIAMVAAAQASGSASTWRESADAYVPGVVRTTWLDQNPSPELRQRVTALASASASSLALVSGEQLAALAARYGVPISSEVAEEISGYFQNRRDAVLTYNK